MDVENGREYQEDNTACHRNNDVVSIEIEQNRRRGTGVNQFEPGLYQDGESNDTSIDYDIKLGGKEPAISDCELALDSEFDEIRVENVRKVGREMLYYPSLVISLSFLLLNDARQAFAVCKEIESNIFIKKTEEEKFRTAGEKLLIAIMNTARKRGLERFDLKLVCALHLLERYAAIETLVPRMSRDSARSKFRNREHTYLPMDRVNLYLICENLGQRDTSVLLEKMRNKFGDALLSRPPVVTDAKPNGTLTGTHLETNLLELFYRGILDANEAETTIKEILPPNVAATLEHVNNARKEDSTIPPGGILKCRKGKCLIINQRDFIARNQPRENHGNNHTDSESFETREGTNMDEEALRKTWEYFCGPANVTSVENLTAEGMRRACNNFRTDLETSNPGDVDFMVLCILSHGRLNTNTNQDEIMDTHWQGVPTIELIDMFALGTSCPSMVGKPKIFIIQACRGRDQNDVVENQNATPQKLFDNDLQEDAITAPKKSWFFILNSTIQGFSAWRHRQEGSFFIQCLCQELRAHGSRKDILEIGRDTLIRVQEEANIMAPVMEYSLARKMYLTEFQ